jgi:ribosomal-protein-alanine N-acetyltransferase
MAVIDIPALIDIEREIYPESPWSAVQFREELAGVPRTHRYIVAYKDSEIIGYGGIALVGDVADIHTLTVISKYRQRGIGSELLKQLESWAKERSVTAFMLEMREGNSQAQSLYEKNGYQIISRRDHYYATGIHALIMRKELSDE